MIVGLGYGLLSTPMAAAVLGAVPRERAGMASSTNLTARLAGGVFGVAVLGALLPAGGSGAGQAFAHGLHTALIAAAAVALAGAVLTAVFIPSKAPASRFSKRGDRRVPPAAPALEFRQHSLAEPVRLLQVRVAGETKPTKLVVIIDIIADAVPAWIHGSRPVAALSENGSVLDVSPHVRLPWAGRS